MNAKEDVKEWLDIVLNSFDGIADAWVDFFVLASSRMIIVGIFMMWFLIAASSPVWVGPFLLYRRYCRKDD